MYYHFIYRLTFVPRNLNAQRNWLVVLVERKQGISPSFFPVLFLLWSSSKNCSKNEPFFSRKKYYYLYLSENELELKSTTTTTATRTSPNKRFNEKTVTVHVRYKSLYITLASWKPRTWSALGCYPFWQTDRSEIIRNTRRKWNDIFRLNRANQ